MAEGEELLKKLGVGKRLPDDALFAAGDQRCRIYVREGVVDIDEEELCHQVVAEFPCEVPGCAEVFSSLLQFEIHYNSRHRFFCCQCKKPLPTYHMLDLHVSETHDSFFAAQAERKPMFRCFVEQCSVLSQDETQRRAHCIDIHSFPHDFRFDQSLKKNKKTYAKPTVKNSTDEMDVDGRKPKVVSKQFTFGQSKRGRSFSKNCQQIPVNEKKSSEQVSNPSSSSEMMDTDTLPPC